MKHALCTRFLDQLSSAESLIDVSDDIHSTCLDAFRSLKNHTHMYESWRYFDFSLIPECLQLQDDVSSEFDFIDTVSLVDGVLVHSDQHHGTCPFLSLKKEACVDQFVSGLPRSVYSYINLLLVQRVVVLDIPDGCDAGELELPMVCSGQSLCTYSRVHIRLGKGSKAVISVPHLQHHENSSCLVNLFIDVYLDKGSSLTLDRMDTSLTASLMETMMVSQEEGSSFNFHSLSCANRLVRRDIQIVLNGVDCSTYVYGLALLDHNERVHNHINLDHRYPSCHAEQVFKSILGGRSFVESNGLVTIFPHAHQCQSTQQNPNLLLSDHARVVTRPQLRIDADDVECGHGATVGQLNETEVLYFMTRGFSRAEAFRVLLDGFTKDITDRFSQVSRDSPGFETISSFLKNYE